MSAPLVACSWREPHEGHVYISYIVGGSPGPVPSITCMCPGTSASAHFWGYCETCGAERTSAIVPTPDGKRTHAVGLQCSVHPEHGPDKP